MSTPARPQYHCGNQRRREQVRAAGTLNGIDFLEVSDDQRVLNVHFLQPIEGTGVVPPGLALTAEHITVVGGEHGRGADVTEVHGTGSALAVTVDAPGDFAAYELRVQEPGTGGQVPTGVDPRLATVLFSFKAGCETDADCAMPEQCPPDPAPEPVLDYLAKDYDSFRTLMLDRLAVTLPGWTERHAADVQVALVELLAYVADHLSWTQDAVATEAHLGTARRRSSVRRHARLLDYRMSEGASARTFVHVTVSTGLTVARGTAMTASDRPGAPVFETLHDLAARPAHNELALHTWSDEECCLPRGATRATLVRPPDAALGVGDLLVLEEVASPDGGPPDPGHRAVVRLTDVREATDPLDDTTLLEVVWDGRDALAESLTVSSRGTAVLVARGNIAVADHGETQPARGFVAELPPPGPWRPLLPDGPLAHRVAYEASAPARGLLDVDPADAAPEVFLLDGSDRWEPVSDLLGAGPSDPAFVIETEDDGSARVRFGDDEYGRRPAADTDFDVIARIGGGTAGNLGPDAINYLVLPVSGVDAVRNVTSATGGTAPESTERVRLAAPQAFRRQRRAITTDDYAAVVAAVPGVQRAAASVRWTGSWYAAHTTVDRVGGAPLTTDGLDQDLLRALGRNRMVGVDVAVREPARVPLDLALQICVAPGADGAQVERGVRRRLGSGHLPDGRRAFFHPDELTLGQPLYLSRLHQAVLEVPGVRWVQATRLQRLGEESSGELDAGVLSPGPLEVIELTVDSSRPGGITTGRLDLTLAGER